MNATVVITTKDRKEDLRVAVRSAVRQSAEAEVLVIDDGSTDGTSAMIREEFPQVRLHREEKSAGLIVRRNQAARLAKGDILFSIDDDAEFSSPHVVEQTLSEFDAPRIGAVAIPYVDVNRSPEVQQQAPDTEKTYCTAHFRGTAHALRRELFLELGGYREHLVHQGEEMDFCVRLLDTGYVVRLGTADIINHYESPRRSFKRMDYYGRRNDILFIWHNIPAALFPFHIARTIVNGFRSIVQSGRPKQMLAGMAVGFVDCVRYAENRDPVDISTYRLYRTLKSQGPLPLDNVRSDLT